MHKLIFRGKLFSIFFLFSYSISVHREELITNTKNNTKDSLIERCLKNVVGKISPTFPQYLIEDSHAYRSICCKMRKEIWTQKTDEGLRGFLGRCHV